MKRPGKSFSRKNVLVSTWSRGTGSSSGMSSDDRILRSATMPGPRVVAAGAGRRLDRVAGVEQHRAALLHIGVDARERLARGLRRARHDRPVDQREEGELVARRIEADRLAGFERGALREEQRQALQAGLADAVDLGVAGDDVGEARLQRRFRRMLVALRRRSRGGARLRRACGERAAARRATSRSQREHGGRRPPAAQQLREPARRARTRPARRAPAGRARRAGPGRAGPAARSAR